MDQPVRRASWWYRARCGATLERDYGLIGGRDGFSALARMNLERLNADLSYCYRVIGAHDERDKTIISPRNRRRARGSFFGDRRWSTFPFVALFFASLDKTYFTKVYTGPFDLTRVYKNMVVETGPRIAYFTAREHFYRLKMTLWPDLWVFTIFCTSWIKFRVFTQLRWFLVRPNELTFTRNSICGIWRSGGVPQL